MEKISNALGFIGYQTLRAPRYLFALLLFTLRVLNPRQQGNYRLNQASIRTLVGQVIFSGIDALPVVSFIAIATGAAVTAQIILTIELLGDRSEVINILVQVVIYELSTLITAIILIGRSGSAITVDLGNMKLSRELEGLEMLGVNLNHFLITPRVYGTCISQAILAIYFAVIATLSGVIFLAYTQSSGYFSYLGEISVSLHPFDLTVFLLKNLLFGVLIGTISSFHAMKVGSSRNELPQQTQKAIVNSITIIFVFNALFLLFVQYG